ncbi:MAG TPA: pyrimidine dimer DNA glycosylase/endonuclease V [bacterium]|nr:pyrimidine dimer DNA glycosylase/endonuclease V [bacterium]
MRLWSLHPKYLDTKGLLALWREGLLAQKVLAGKTKGYRNHPQLDRFWSHSKPKAAIGRYLLEVWSEADRRGFSFDRGKVKNASGKVSTIPVARGQLGYEREHLRKKLKFRDLARWKSLKKSKKIQPHPCFRAVPGNRADWEKI